MLRSAHGQARKGGRTVVIETAPVDELPAGESRDARLALPPDAPTRLSRGGDAEAARAMQRRSAVAQAAKRAAALRMLTSFGLEVERVPADLVPYLDRAQEWCEAEVKRVADEVGGGVCSPAVAALIQQAGLALAYSRHAAEQGKGTDAVRFGAEVRANMLAAHELAAKEAKARPKAMTNDWTALFPAAAQRREP